MLPCIHVRLTGVDAVPQHFMVACLDEGARSCAVFLLEEGLATDNHWTQKKGSVRSMSKSALSSCSSWSRACRGRLGQGWRARASCIHLERKK